MAEAAPAVWSVPAHAHFARVLADLLRERAGGDPVALARTLVLLPNRRAAAALTAAFVAEGEGGVLLPRMLSVGDLEDAAVDGAADAPLAIGAAERRFALAGMLARGGTPPARALAEASALASTLGALIDGGRTAADLRGAIAEKELAEHWERTLARLEAIVTLWPAVLAARGLVEPETRSVALAAALAASWRAQPPEHGVVAAGIVAAPPHIGRLLHAVARLPGGLVLLPGLDLEMSEAAWTVLEPGTPAGEAHAMGAMKALLGALGVARGEVREITAAGPTPRLAAARRALDPAAFVAAGAGGAMAGVTRVEATGPGHEAQLIALALRRALDTPGETAALVTPDRDLARRVAGHLARWGIAIDDSAGEPLSLAPAGRLLGLIAAVAAADFAPAALFALLDHPLVGGDARAAWREAARALDAKLRGMAPPPGLAGIARRVPDAAAGWWAELTPMLAPLNESTPRPLAQQLTRIVDVADALAGEAAWRGDDGRAAAALIDEAQQHGDALGPLDWPATAAVLARLMDEVAVRPSYGRHPRLAILGLLEARLQRAHTMILGGLNEGVWPAVPAPDPWLPPIARRALGLPPPERRLGLAAQDFLNALGAPRVILTRAKRNASQPTVPSRLWQRLITFAGPIEEDTELLAAAVALDAAEVVTPVSKPAPAPPPELRPRRISVTQVDVLATDPFAFYAQAMLGLRRWRGLSEEPTAQDRGVFVHALLADWHHAKLPPDALPGLAAARLASDWRGQPLAGALWGPRLADALGWTAERLRARAEDGWQVAVVEVKGALALGEVRLIGKPDRIDRAQGGQLAIIDYKTGAPPSLKQLHAGYAAQLGLLARMAAVGAFEGVAAAPVAELAHWQLSGSRKEPGKACDPLRGKEPRWPDAAAWADEAARHLDALIDRFLIGEAAFVPKLKPEWALFSKDYDQLARLDEWIGRG